MKKNEVIKISIRKLSKTEYEGKLLTDRKLTVENLEAAKDWIVTNLDRAIEDKKKIE